MQQSAHRQSKCAYLALLLYLMLLQVQSAAEEAVSASRQQTPDHQAQPMQLCHKLQQQLAKELSRLPRMQSEPMASLESAVPIMMQLPQLTISVLMAIIEQQAAEQVAPCRSCRRCLLHCLSSVGFVDILVPSTH